jgi:single-stranded-DNA-specific exonuclease
MTEENIKSSELTARLARQLAIPLLGAQLLHSLGVENAREGHDFLFPTLASLPSPWLLKGMEEGVELVLSAQAEKTPVIVFGDYDVDGVCSTVLLVTFLKTMGMDVDWYIPDRLSEGYGLSTAAMEGICAKMEQPGLVITVDNGIAAVDEIKQLRENGFSILITDHHKPGKTIPEAHAVIDPHQPGCQFPFAGLAGAGVAFFLIMALRSALVRKKKWSRTEAPNLKEYLDLVALGTVADSMPLRETNRILARAGLEILSQQKRPGLKALCNLARIGGHGSSVTAEDISFYLGPRINAAGRMGNADAAMELIEARDETSAMQAATRLEEINDRRKKIQDEMAREAIEQCKKVVEQQPSILVLFDKKWHPGVVGIVAAKISEQYQLPALVLTEDPRQQGQIKGSGRGTGTCDLFEEIRQCSELLAGFGGHSQAIGLKLRKENLQSLIERLNTNPGRVDSDNKITGLNGNIKEIDRIDDVLNKDFIYFLGAMEPFGRDNPEPVFLYQGARALKPALIKQKHLRFSIQWTQNRICDVIAFNQARNFSLLNDLIDINFRVRKNSYRGQERVQLVAERISASS